MYLNTINYAKKGWKMFCPMLVDTEHDPMLSLLAFWLLFLNTPVKDILAGLSYHHSYKYPAFCLPKKKYPVLWTFGDHC